MSLIRVGFAHDNSYVSQVGDFTNPIRFTLRQDLNQEAEMRMFVEIQHGYVADTVTISFAEIVQGQSVDKWQLAPDNDGTPGTYRNWGQPLTISNLGYGNDRAYFWVKARQTSDEQVGGDQTVALKVEV